MPEVVKEFIFGEFRGVPVKLDALYSLEKMSFDLKGSRGCTLVCPPVSKVIKKSHWILNCGHYRAGLDDFCLPMLPDGVGRFGYRPPGLVEGWMEVEYNLRENCCFSKSSYSRLALLTFSIKLSILLSFGFLTQTSQSCVIGLGLSGSPESWTKHFFYFINHSFILIKIYDAIFISFQI